MSLAQRAEHCGEAAPAPLLKALWPYPYRMRAAGSCLLQTSLRPVCCFVAHGPGAFRAPSLLSAAHTALCAPLTMGVCTPPTEVRPQTPLCPSWHTPARHALCTHGSAASLCTPSVCALCARAQGALQSMFGGQLNPSELISVQQLQAQTQPDHMRFTQPPAAHQVRAWLCSF